MAESKSRHAVKTPDPRAEFQTDPPTVSQRLLASGQSTAGHSVGQLSADDQIPSAAGHRLADRYQLIEKLGAGAMGTVYKAEDVKLGRTVAIKILPERSTPDPEAVARFQREARALAKLSHAAIVQAFDEDQDGGRHFLVMEYVAGKNLAAVIKDKGAVPPTRAAAYAHQAALGLAHAHERGLVHRDLKPGNILLTPDGDVKILDLGLARFLQDQIGDATLTIEGSGVGTPDYMAPEQFVNARNVDRRADIYSLGCTLYHLIAGRVPFPTSSLTEKYAAHERHEPPPLEDLCPDVPAGLAMAISRMMAKRPEDRFQTAAEAAEALAPYVAGSSQSFQGLKATASWHGSQLGISVAPLARQRRQRMVAAGVLSAVAAAVILLALWLSGMFGGSSDPIANVPPASPGNESGPVPPLPPVEPEVPDDPNVLTVAQSGKAEYRTIGEALAAVVRPDMTIHILDDATYDEVLYIDNAAVQSGLTIDSPRRAILQTATSKAALVRIENVPGVTIRDLQLRAGGPTQTLVVVHGAAPGLLLQRLDLAAGSADDFDGIGIFGMTNQQDEPPAVVADCTIQGGRRGLVVLGMTLDGTRPLLTNRVLLTGNKVIRPSQRGIFISGELSEVLVAGNLVIGPTLYSGLEFQTLQDARDVLAANNTLFNCSPAVLVLDSTPAGERIELAANLVLNASGADMVHFAESTGPLPAAGDPERLLEQWKFHANWREAAAPEGETVFAQSWIPRAPDDVLQKPIDVLSRVPQDADFLRPAADSDLATKGAGGDLPAFVGARPPPGSTPWDWMKTWDSRYPGRILTVSQNPQDGGTFRTIGEAMLQARPGVTIRLLDDKEYAETLAFDNRTSQAGLTIEAENGAAITSSESAAALVTVDGVAGVTLRGLTLRAKGPKQTQVAVIGGAPGLVLDGLDLDATAVKDCDGIVFYGANHPDDQPPAVVRNCTIRGGQVGLALRAYSVNILALSPVPCRRIVIAGNTILQPKMVGIVSMGKVEDVHIVGNRIHGHPRLAAGLQFQELSGASDVLVANNSFLACSPALCVWDTAAHGERFEILRNLVLGAVKGDFVFVDGGLNDSQPRGAGDSKRLSALWTFQGNWREVSDQSTDPMWISPGVHDERRDVIDVLARLPAHEDFLRPAADSDLATKVAGDDLPSFVGAMPPPGMPAWDWMQTWTTRQR